MTTRESGVVHREGFWGEGISIPVHSDTVWRLKTDFIRKLLAIEDISEYTTYKGISLCRCCGNVNGNKEFSYRGYYWPQGFLHYVSEHNVLPSETFSEFIDREYKNIRATPNLFIYVAEIQEIDEQIRILGDRKDSLLKSIRMLKGEPSEARGTGDEIDKPNRKRSV